MEWDAVYDAYPVNKELIWLNNCGITPAGSHIAEAVSRFVLDYAQKCILAETAQYDELKQNIKTILAGVLGCQAAELALIHHTAEGMNFISHGLTLEPGDEIILLENEYPSNVYPWLHWKKKGVKVLTAPTESLPEVFFKKFSRLITKKTRIVSLSAVHWCTGMPLPIEAVGRLCQERGIDLVVDGAQGVGMQPIDVKKACISYMAFSAWKWLMGPLGMGVFYVNEKKLEELNPIFIGTESVIDDRQYLPYKSELKPGADRFTLSTASIGDWVYFKAALSFLEDIGFETARERIYYLTDYLNQGLRHIGFQVLSDQFSSHPTGITVCEKPGVPSHAVVAHLSKHGIVAAERLRRIRFSPHIYISPSRLDEVIRVLSLL